MTHSFHFISGMPRSSSTLLGAILRQNPRFQAGMTSPVASLFEGLLGQVSAGAEISTMVDEKQRERLLRGLFDQYYADCDAEVIFDTNRAWTANLDALMKLFPDSKMICTVRDVNWVLDSLERQYRDNAFENTRLFSTPAERATVYTRTEALAGSNRLVGFAYQALREACYGESANRLVMVDYNLLAADQKTVIGLIYDFLGEEPYDHDFDNVIYDAPEFDTQLGLRGLHTVRKKVELSQRPTILPPDLFSRYDNMAFWRDLKGSAAFRIVREPKAKDANGDGAAETSGACDDSAVPPADVVDTSSSTDQETQLHS